MIRAYRVDKEVNDPTSVDILTPARRIAWSNGIDAIGVDHYQYVRGFVAYIVARSEIWLANGNEIADRCPLQYLSVNGGAKPVLRDLLQAPFMKHVMSLDLSRNDLDDNDVRLLADSGLSGLRWLSLGRNPLTPAAAEVMAAATPGRFPELHTINFPETVGDIYDDTEGGYGAHAIPSIVHRPEAGIRLRAKYGDLKWLTPRPPGLSGYLYA